LLISESLLPKNLFVLFYSPLF